MINKLLFMTLFFFGCFSIQSQVISGKIINKTSLEPIFKAAILTDLKTGTDSNKFGEYQLQIKNVKSITISCLGYVSKTIAIEDLKKQKFVVALIENINELDEIELNLTKINVDSLLIKTQRSMKDHFISDTIQSHFYTRENSEINFKKLDLELEKSTLLNKKSRKLAEQELNNYARELRESNPKVVSEFFGILKSQKQYSKEWKRDFYYTKIDTIQGINFINNSKNISIESAQKDLQNIILKHIDTNKTHKISSGLFRIEDSLSLKEIIKETDSLATDNSFDKNNATYYYNYAMRNAAFFKVDNKRNFLSKKYYHHKLEKNEFLGNKMFYTLSFLPRKSNSKFSGKIFINPDDFTITKITYAFADEKSGQSINLKWILGLKVSEDINSAAIYYEKNNHNQVYLAYVKETKGSYAYVHRPIKFKENGGERQKVKFDIKIEVAILATSEILLTDTYVIEKFKIIPKKKKQPSQREKYISLSDYNKANWKNRQLITAYLEKWK